MLDALEWLEAHRQEIVREATILHYHRLVLQDPSCAGVYRKHSMFIPESRVQRPEAPRVPALMKQLDLALLREQERLDEMAAPEGEAVMNLALRAHQKIAFIHPFGDANGRVARLIMNHLLRRYGLGYVILPPLSESPEHWDALEAGHKGSFESLAALAWKHCHKV